MAKTATKTTQPKQPEKPATRPVNRAGAATGRTTSDKPTHEEIDKRDIKKLNNAPAVRTAAPAPSTTSANLPAHMRDDVDMGKENIGQNDMEMPRLKLMQGLSKELTLYDELRPGHFLHTASEMMFDEPFKVVPVYMDRQFILWRPRGDGGGIIARAPDGVHWSPPSGEFEVKLDPKDGGAKVKWKLMPTVEQSGLANWGTMDPGNSNSPPAATLMYNFVMMFPDFPDLMPAVMTFQRSSIKIGRKFMTKLKTVRTPLFGSVFMLSSFDDHNAASQDYKNIQLTGAGIVTDPEQYALYKDMHMALKSSGLNIKDVDSLQEDPEAAGANEPEGSPNY